MIKHIYHAFFFALAGLRDTFKTEVAFRIEVLASLVLVPAAWLLTPDALERVLLIGVWFLVMVVELLNSGIEAAIDRIGAERHPLSKKAKDAGAAAVLLAIILAVIVWVGVLI